MATERQRAEWFRTGCMIAWLVNTNGWVKQGVSLNQVIPEPYRPPDEQPRELTPEERKEQRRRFWGRYDAMCRRK